jgi:hypothetical protein
MFVAHDMSLKRLLNDDDDDVVYSPTTAAAGLYSPPGSAYAPYGAFSMPSSMQSTIPRSGFTSPTGTNQSPSDDYGDVPIVEEPPSRTLNDVFSELLNGAYVGADVQAASVNNFEMTETSYYNIDESLEQWAAENMPSLSQSTQRSPSQATPTPTTPSLAQDSIASTAATTEDEEPADVVCYGTVRMRGH